MDMGRRVELAIKHTGLIRIGLTQVCSDGLPTDRSRTCLSWTRPTPNPRTFQFAS